MLPLSILAIFAFPLYYLAEFGFGAEMVVQNDSDGSIILVTLAETVAENDNVRSKMVESNRNNFNHFYFLFILFFNEKIGG